MPIIYLIRHGQALHNVAEEYFSKYANDYLCSKLPKGETLAPEIQKKLNDGILDMILSDLVSIDDRYEDPSLTELGRAQADHLKILTQDFTFDAIGVSPLYRALQTLDLSKLYTRSPVPPIVMKEFREVSGGHRFTDRCKELTEKKSALPTFDFSRSGENEDLWPVHREGSPNVGDRFSKGIEELIRLNPNGKTFAVVAHKGTATRFCQLHGKPIANPANCDLIKVDLKLDKDKTYGFYVNNIELIRPASKPPSPTQKTPDFSTPEFITLKEKLVEATDLFLRSLADTKPPKPSAPGTPDLPRKGPKA